MRTAAHGTPGSRRLSPSIGRIEPVPFAQRELQGLILGFLVEMDVAALEEDLQPAHARLDVMHLVSGVPRGAHAYQRRQTASTTWSARDRGDRAQDDRSRV